MEFNFQQLEEKILKFWQENKIFEKSIKQRQKAPNFVFYEGPPTANASPGVHHVLSRVFKDIICRYKTMRGFRVERKAGWDTHGLPVELEIEKKMGLKSKKDIEKYGISKFNKKCKESVWEYKKDWEKLTERIGFWIDMKNPYITYTPDYIESVWWILKQIWQKGLLYKDYKVVPYCPRCGTSLSSHEVALGYKRIKEPAIYVKFPILNPEFKNTSLLVWTTTPWTLPGNVAVAVNPEFDYIEIETNEESLILAKERSKILGIGGKIKREMKGEELIGLKYEPPFDFYKPNEERIWEVLPGDFVSLEEGTGLVHIAPAFGEEDMELIKMTNSKIQMPNERFPILLNVDEEGKFTLEVKKWTGLFVKDADPLIIDDLKQRKLLFKEELYEHDYPFCWRCHSPLLYYAKQSWFINIQKVKNQLIENNKKINWIPPHLKEGRFGEWLKEIKDWALSRERYWGTPLPVWQCQTGKSETRNSKFKKKCNNIVVIGSKEDLLKQKFSTNNYYIFRHGHSLRQVKKLASCWPEKVPFPLTREGKREIKEAAKKLKSKKIDLIFSSDLLRTRQSAEIISKETGAKIIFDKRLREYNVGIFNGKDPNLVWEYLAKKRDLISARPPKGESLREVGKRMFSFLREINEKYQGKNILIVSHELPLTILEGTLKGYSLEEILELRRKRKIKVIGTGQFRKIEFKNLPFNEKMEFDFHRPYIDEVKFYCPECQEGLMKRVPEVIDCWFDSGSMPFAQAHWPFAQKSKIKSQKLKPPELFPADYISEGIDQTRGWFYTLLAISTLLGFGPAYKNVISLGHVLDEKGEKMSKSKGNVVNPWYIVEKYGADATRWYFFTINQPGDSKLFSEKDVEESLKKFIMTFWNCYAFFGTYVPKKKSKVKSQKSKVQFKSQNLLDKWIVSKLNKLIQQTTESLEKYDVTGAARAIENFVIEDLSQWYIRRSRRRFQKPETKAEAEGALTTLNFILLTLSKLTAPFIPFLSEEIYQKISNFQFSISNSVHLENWPKAEKNLINEDLEKKMKKVREIVALALAERAKTGIKVRQPLALLKIKDNKLEIKGEKDLLDLIKEEVNVKEIIFDEKIEREVELDTRITPELKEEGILREVMRNIQEMRKIAKLTPRNIIRIKYQTANLDYQNLIEKWKDYIKKETLAESLEFVQEKRDFEIEKEIDLEGERLWLGIKKL